MKVDSAQIRLHLKMKFAIFFGGPNNESMINRLYDNVKTHLAQMKTSLNNHGLEFMQVE